MPEKRLVFDLATSTLRCTGCGRGQRLNGATIPLVRLVQLCEAFVAEHTTCGLPANASKGEVLNALAGVLGARSA